MIFGGLQKNMNCAFPLRKGFMLHWTGNKEVGVSLLLLLLLLSFILSWSNLSIYNVKYISREVWSIHFFGFTVIIERQSSLLHKVWKGLKWYFLSRLSVHCKLGAELKIGRTTVIIIMQITTPYLYVKSTWRQGNGDSCKSTCRQRKCWFM